MIHKKLFYRVGLGLTIIGLIITLIGFAMADWQIDKYQEEEPVSWYRTVRFN